MQVPEQPLGPVLAPGRHTTPRSCGQVSEAESKGTGGASPDSGAGALGAQQFLV